VLAVIGIAIGEVHLLPTACCFSFKGNACKTSAAYGPKIADMRPNVATRFVKAHAGDVAWAISKEFCTEL
jgi:hypothetical protein